MLMRKILLIVLAASIAGCSGTPQKQAKPISPAIILNKLELPGMIKVSPVQTYVGDSLYEYIDGGAELYHQYNFKDVSTIELKYNDIELIADIYRFDAPIDAYGLYSIQRPEVRPDVSSAVAFGVEGYASETSLDFVKGAYLVKLIGFEPSPKTSEVLSIFAEDLDRLTPGTTKKPETLQLFPHKGIINYTDKYMAVSFLGHAFLNGVFTQEYHLDGDTLTLFLTDDPAGEKLRQWANQVKLSEAGMKFLKDLPYLPGQSFLAEDNYYGKLVVGSVDGKLAGILNFKENQKTFLSGWLKSLSSK